MRVPRRDAAPALPKGKTVYQETTTPELRTQLRNGWLGSIVLHGLLLLSFLPLFRQSLLTVPTEPFHWDVTLIQSAQTADKLVPTANAAEQTVSSRLKQAPIPTRVNRPIQHVAPSAERIAPIEPQITEPIAPTSQPRIASAATLPEDPATAALSEKPTPNQPQASDPQLQQAGTPANSTTADPSAAQTAAATSTEGSSSVTGTAQLSSPPVAASAPDPVSTQRPDYGWLQQAIFKRLEELKRSSRPSLEQSQPIKVLVKAVVSREGALLDSSVARSSGLDHIDQEAMALVQRAFPMQLDRTLDRQQIVMRIPITYSRE
jgi:TonB family protein